MIAAALTVSPLLVALLTTAVTLLLARKPHRQRVASLVGAGMFLACAMVLLVRTAAGETFTMQFGNWAAPFAIMFHIDRLGALMLTVSGLMALVTLIFPARGESCTSPTGLPLVHGLLAGASGAYATADLFNLYVWFEIMLISALGLIVIGGKTRHLEAGLKYLGLNLVGTILLLISIAAIYGLTGQLNYFSVSAALAAQGFDSLAAVLVVMLTVSLLIKCGAFPFLFWLPASYPVLPVPMLALFTALTTKVAAYAMLRITGQILPGGVAMLSPWLGWIAVATMIVGVLGAVHHSDIRRILAFHSVSQMGYILLAIALGGEIGMVAAVFFIVHHVLVKSNLYLIAGIIARCGGDFDSRRTGGLLQSAPALAALFALSACALVGVPPLSGFWAKLLLVREGLSQQMYVWAGAALFVSGLTLLSMVKIWIEAFWKPHPDAGLRIPVPLPRAGWFACATLSILIVTLGLFPGVPIAFVASAVGSVGFDHVGGTP
jgi:multicomponent Na+:H+ antiporter subunit D